MVDGCNQLGMKLDIAGEYFGIGSTGLEENVAPRKQTNYN